MVICSCAFDASPFTGFDDVRFRLLVDQQTGELADWAFAPIIVSKHVPNSNNTVNQIMGTPAAKVTWQLWFDCHHHFEALLGRQGTLGTLRILTGLQSLLGTQESYLDRVYDLLDQTMLLSLASTVRYRDGHIESQATFQRAVDPVTRLAVVP